MQGLNWDKLRCFSSTGEASSPEDYHWLSAMAGYKPVIEYCGGTEIGGAFLGGTMVQPQAPSHFSTPTIGCRLALLDDQTVLYDSLQGSFTSGLTNHLLPCSVKLCQAVLGCVVAINYTGVPSHNKLSRCAMSLPASMSRIWSCCCSCKL